MYLLCNNRFNLVDSYLHLLDRNILTLVNIDKILFTL